MPDTLNFFVTVYTTCHELPVPGQATATNHRPQHLGIDILRKIRLETRSIAAVLITVFERDFKTETLR